MFNLSLLTPEKKVVMDQEIEFVTVPLTSGEVQILAGHVPMVATLGTGVLKYKLKNTSAPSQVVISWGYCEVTPTGVSVLAEFVKTKEEVNADVEKTTITQNQAKLLTESQTEETFEVINTEIEKAQASLRLVQ